MVPVLCCEGFVVLEGVVEGSVGCVVPDSRLLDQGRGLERKMMMGLQIDLQFWGIEVGRVGRRFDRVVCIGFVSVFRLRGRNQERTGWALHL